MSYSGDAAEQVVRMSLEGAEVAAKITGAGAKEIAVLLYAVLKEQKKSKGKMRLTNMLKSGKELKVFAVKDADLSTFCMEAKKYGVLYCVLKDRDAKDGITDIMVRAEDASKVNRIFERFKLTTMDMASVRSEIERARAEKVDDIPEPVRPGQQRSKEDIFLDALMSNPSKEETQTANPTEARVAKSRQSAPSSEQKMSDAKGNTFDPVQNRPSVRQALKDIRAEMNRKDVATEAPAKKQEQMQHIHPAKRKNKKKKER